MNFQEATKHIQSVDYSFLQDHEEAVLNKMRETATPAVLKIVDDFLVNYTNYGNKYHTSYVAAMADESGAWADCRSKTAIIAFAKQFVVAANVVKSEIEAAETEVLSSDQLQVGTTFIRNNQLHEITFISPAILKGKSDVYGVNVEGDDVSYRTNVWCDGEMNSEKLAEICESMRDADLVSYPSVVQTTSLAVRGVKARDAAINWVDGLKVGDVFHGANHEAHRLFHKLEEFERRVFVHKAAEMLFALELWCDDATSQITKIER